MSTSSATHRDFVWEADYGDRKPVLDVLAQLLDEQKATELAMCSLFANNNIYCLEFYVALGYEEPREEQIRRMTHLFKRSGARPRLDVTLADLLGRLRFRRFEFASVVSSEQLRAITHSKEFFFWPERSYFDEKFDTKPLGESLPVFLSHASPDKEVVERVIPYLQRAGSGIWYDKYDIKYGQSIVQAVQKGISNSAAVVFFISGSFLGSAWCQNELDGFLTRLCTGHEVLILSLVFPGVEHEDLPMFLQQRKYLALQSPISAAAISSELTPVLKDWFKI